MLALHLMLVTSKQKSNFRNIFMLYETFSNLSLPILTLAKNRIFEAPESQGKPCNFDEVKSSWNPQYIL